MARRNQIKQKGVLMIELMVAVGIMAILFTALAVIGGTFRKVNGHRWAQHTMTSAGQAQMDAIAVTGKPIDEQTFKRLWPDVTCTVDITPGQDPWQGLWKVQLHLSAKSRGETVKTSFIRYIWREKESQK